MYITYKTNKTFYYSVLISVVITSLLSCDVVGSEVNITCILSLGLKTGSTL